MSAVGAVGSPPPRVWPIPDRAATLRLTGRRTARRLLDDNDLSELDGNLLVLFAASDLLARQGSEDAQLALGKAQRLLRQILVRQDSDKDRPFIIGGGPPPAPGGLGTASRIRVPR